MNMGRWLPRDDQSPAFEPVAAKSAKTVNRMIAAACMRLTHDDGEIVTAPGALSSDVFSHRVGVISLTPTVMQAGPALPVMREVRYGLGHRFSLRHVWRAK